MIMIVIMMVVVVICLPRVGDTGPLKSRERRKHDQDGYGNGTRGGGVFHEGKALDDCDVPVQLPFVIRVSK